MTGQVAATAGLLHRFIDGVPAMLINEDFLR